MKNTNEYRKQQISVGEEKHSIQVRQDQGVDIVQTGTAYWAIYIEQSHPKAVMKIFLSSVWAKVIQCY